VKERLSPPRIDANQEVGMALCMVVEGLFIDNSATGYMTEWQWVSSMPNWILPNQPSGGPGEW